MMLTYNTAFKLVLVAVGAAIVASLERAAADVRT
jgi:hypothetical protein